MRDVPTRRAGPGDERAIAEIHVKGWRWAYRDLMPQDVLASLSVQRREEQWRVALAPGREWPAVWVAGPRRVAGFIASGPPETEEPVPGTVQLYAIYVDPGAVGTGVGRALMDRAVRDYRARGLERAFLYVLEGNDRARRFYEAAGWAPDGTDRWEEFGGTRLRELRYALDLTGSPRAS